MTSLSIVVLSWNRGDLLRKCLEHIWEADVPNDTQLVLLDNGSTDPAVHEVLDAAEASVLKGRWQGNHQIRRYPANLMNEAYNLARDLYEGDNILLVNTDCFVRGDTITRMLAAKSESNDWAMQPEYMMGARAGVVGAQLLYGDGRVQHGGVTLDPTTRLPSHSRRYAPPVLDGQPRDMPGVTGALVLYDKRCWDELGGLGHEFPLYFTDIDFCLRAWEKGWTTVYAEDAIATHLEAASHVPTQGLPRGYEEQQAHYLAKWGPGRPLPAPVHRMVYG